MKKTLRFFVLLAMVGMCLGLSSNLMAAGGTVDPSQLKKIKVGMTEPEVKAILGEPSKAEDKIKNIRGGRESFELRVLSYGSEEGADLIFLNKQSGKVYKVVPN
jgi:hypothetical protein